jgi:ABC-type metal ion transport system substrate-binding protein
MANSPRILLVILSVGLLVLARNVEQSHAKAANIIDIYKNVVFEYAVMKNPKPVVVFYYQSR